MSETMPAYCPLCGRNTGGSAADSGVDVCPECKKVLGLVAENKRLTAGRDALWAFVASVDAYLCSCVRDDCCECNYCVARRAAREKLTVAP